ncbi:Conserved_hypothetical protein [Hexamita inflata]|uniref:Frag1/DRAM/Sfk1 family protein n=1 Tax=Hexamita inflata TaxID=28002 RepID=A0AA86PHU4_9EUKA|nr:Conserved hypothetical protein [Hexamita inflata]
MSKDIQEIVISTDTHNDQPIKQLKQVQPKRRIIKNYILGRFSRTQLYSHVYGGFALILFCYFMALILYPKENGYSIFKQTYSNLGSFDSISNYRGWYFYSILQFISFLVNVPMSFYQHDRLKLIGNKISIVACGSMILGAVCQLILGFFPASIQPLYKNLMWGDIHNNVGYAGFGFCLLGYVLYAILVAMDRTRCSTNKKRFLNHVPVDLIVSLVIITFLLTTIAISSWLVIYPIRKKKDPSMPNFRTASQYTFFCFTMWENFFVYSLYIFNFVFPLVLPFRTDGITPKQVVSQKMFNFKGEKVELKTELSKKFSIYLQAKKIRTNVKVNQLLEHLADYEEVQGLLSPRSIITLQKINQSFNLDLLKNERTAIKKEIKENDELWPWRRILYRCIE